MPLPTDSNERKRIPIFSGVLAYFPDAIAEVAKVSHTGNEKHNPGQPLHWSRSKSDDHEDCIQRHTLDALNALNTGAQAERVEHLAQRAWRALAALQLAVETRDLVTRIILDADLVEETRENAERMILSEEFTEGGGLPSFYRIVP